MYYIAHCGRDAAGRPERGPLRMRDAIPLQVAALTWRRGRKSKQTSRALMEGINMEKSSQGCYEAMQLSQ